MDDLRSLASAVGRAELAQVIEEHVRSLASVADSVSDRARSRASRRAARGADGPRAARGPRDRDRADVQRRLFPQRVRSCSRPARARCIQARSVGGTTTTSSIWARTAWARARDVSGKASTRRCAWPTSRRICEAKPAARRRIHCAYCVRPIGCCGNPRIPVTSPRCSSAFSPPPRGGSRTSTAGTTAALSAAGRNDRMAARHGHGARRVRGVGVRAGAHAARLRRPARRLQRRRHRGAQRWRALRRGAAGRCDPEPRRRAPDLVIAGILERVQSFSAGDQSDDLTLLVARLR